MVKILNHWSLRTYLYTVYREVARPQILVRVQPELCEIMNIHMYNINLLTKRQISSIASSLVKGLKFIIRVIFVEPITLNESSE